MGASGLPWVAVYSVSPVDLLYKYGTLPIVGLVCFSWVLWRLSSSDSTKFVCLAGMYGQLLAVSMLSFWDHCIPNAYLEGVKRIGAVPGLSCHLLNRFRQLSLDGLC